MNVEIITTGEEVLSGQIVDTNAAWLSQFFEERGVTVARRVTVGDRLDDLAACFRERSRFADVIVVNGGLGPTSDDMSAEAAARALDEPLVEFPQWIEVLEAKYRAMSREMAPANRKQAQLPRSATLIDNPVGTACGFSIKLEDCVLYFTPGVPSEFKKMIRDQVFPNMRERFRLDGVSLLKRLHCFGVAESRLANTLQPLAMPPGVALGFRAHLPTIEIKVMGRGSDGEALQRGVDQVAQAIRDQLGENLVFEDDRSIERDIQEAMIARGYTLALAESCTGGMVSAQLVDIPGSSAYLDRAYVTYSNRAKTEMIGVPAEVIEEKGAVSLETAQAMARGAQRAAGVSHALAITGVAGPGGGTPDKPVGTVGFALAALDELHAQIIRLPPWGRGNIRRISAMAALDMLRRWLNDLPVFGRFDLSKIVQSEVAKG